jgi:hypothetical protein
MSYEAVGAAPAAQEKKRGSIASLDPSVEG